ncbi:MAG: ATP-binding domain-containing protein [Bacteroidales bacterium]|nr:ATP-binding domain-containing protein [Bacteroidales bacterium]
MVIRFDSRIVPYLYSELDEISLAYAMTVHKSQGSEYPIVVIPITYANKIMMQRNLIYTAITRAKNICVIIGSIKMVELGIGKANSYKRKTMLKERLIENSV